MLNVEDIANHIAKKHGLPKLIRPEEAVNKVIKNIRSAYSAVMVIFTDNTALYLKYEVGESGVETEWRTGHDENSIVAITDCNSEAYREYEKLYSAESVRVQDERERAEFQRLKAKFEGQKQMSKSGLDELA